MKSKKSADGQVFWDLAAFFKGEAPVGWRPQSITFERDVGVVRAAGARWSTTFTIHGPSAGHEGIELLVSISQEEGLGSRGLAARRRLALFQHLEAVEQEMWKRRFRSRFTLDDHDETWAGYFRKYLGGLAAVRRELGTLASLRVGKRGEAMSGGE